jgi:small-conductance mechanosensitive channel
MKEVFLMTDLIQWFEQIFITPSVQLAGAQINLLKVIGFLIVFGAFIVIAWFARKLLRQFLTRLHFEENTRERLLWLVTIAIVLAGLPIGIENVIGVDLAVWRRVFTASIPIGSARLSFANLFLLIAVIISAALLSKYVRLILRDRVLPPFQLAENAQFLLLRLVHLTIIFFGAFIGLNLTGLSLSSLMVVLGGLSIGLGFGLQNIASNLVSGVILIFERPIRVGDRVTVGDTFGTVRAINMRSTEILSPDNISIIVPNSQFITETITNWTYSDKIVRIRIPIGVAYGSDTALVKQALLEVAQAHPQIFKDSDRRYPMVTAPFVRFLGFGDSALQFELVAWIPDVEFRLMVISDLHFMINQKFQEYKITIPFPQRDVHIYTESALSC